MKQERHRMGIAVFTLAVASVTLLGGCVHGDPASLEMFLTDLLRGAAAALLL